MNTIGDNLKKVRLLKDLSLRQAALLLNMTATGVAKYEKGEIIPNSSKLIEFANAYNVNALDFLSSYEVPLMKFNAFRKRKSLSGRKLELLKVIIQDEVAKYFQVLELNNSASIKNKIVKYDCKSLNDAENASIAFRKINDISLVQPISNLIDILENIEILVIQIKNNDNMFDKFDGLCEIVNDIPIIVILDDINDGARQRFTIAHELGHLFLNVTDENLDIEKLCNRFASSLLMPKESVINEFGEHRNNISWFELKAFKNEYKVSYAAIIYRLWELGIISDSLNRKLNIQINKLIGKNDPNPITPEKSYHFKKLVYKLESSSIISINKACELLNVGFDEYIEENNTY